MGRRNSRGQAAVEAAITLSLLLFLTLGILQLFLMGQARLLAQYAVGRAVRAGSTGFGDCTRMTHTAVLSVLPSFTSFLGAATAGATPDEKLANAFRLRRGNRFAGSGTQGDGSPDDGYDGPVVWLFREQPDAATIRGMAGGQDLDFDQGGLMRLEVRMIYWYPMRIPFVNWAFARMFLAQWGALDYARSNPYLPLKTARWTARPGFGPDAEVTREMVSRAAARQYVFPIDVNSTMRMMTPASARYFLAQNCPPLP